MILLLSIFLPIIILIYLLHETREKARSNLPPSPPRLPLIGNLHQLATARDLHIYLSQLSKKYKSPIIHMKLGSLPLIVISSAKLAKEVLKTQDLAFCSRPKLLGMQKISYNYTDIIFCPYNAYWREMRKITSLHLFSLKKNQSFRPIREEEISRMIARIDKRISDNSTSPSISRVANMSDMATALGGSLICRIAFGKDYDVHGSEMRRFEDLLEGAQSIPALFFVGDYFPRLGWVDKLTGSSKKVDEYFEKSDSFYEELIDEHLDPKKRVKKMDEEDDILDILIKLKEEQKSASIQLTWDNVKAVLMDIFVAGTGTGAAAIVWTMTALIKSPNAMKKLQSEIRSSMGKKGKVDEDDLLKLPYLKAVVKESLRLYPPGPLLIPRETMERCTLEGYEIQPNTMVYVNAYAAGRDPECWENPDEFLPERFLNSDIDVKGQDFGLIPFGSGRRMCPGMSMGLANVELAIANLFYAFEWELPPGVRAEDVDTDPMPGLAAGKKNALLLVPKKYDV